MLFLTSLSSSDTKWWLAASEIVLLVATAVLVLGLIGEWPDSENWKTRIWYKLAKVAVIVGVIGELFGDAGIFETSARLQTLEGIAVADLNTHAEELRSANLKLEAEIAPRRLSADDIAALKVSVRPFANREVSIWSYGIDLEARILAREILSALGDAQVPTIDRIGNMISSTEPRIGVIVSGPDDQLIETLLKALKPVSAVRGPYTSDNDSPVHAEIFVGTKPVSP
jgi:hypothetical protein